MIDRIGLAAGALLLALASTLWARAEFHLGSGANDWQAFAVPEEGEPRGSIRDRGLGRQCAPGAPRELHRRAGGRNLPAGIQLPGSRPARDGRWHAPGGMDRSPGEPRPRQRPLRPGRQRLQQRQHRPPCHAGPAGGHRRGPHHHPSDPVAAQSPPGRASGPRRHILRGLGLGGDRQSGQADAHQPRPRLPAAGPPGRCRRHRRHGGAEARPGAVRGDQFRRQLPRVVRDRGDRQRRSHQGVSRQHRRRGAPGPGPVQAVLRRHRVRRLGLHGPQLRGPDPDPGEPGPGDRSEVPDPPRALRLGTPLPPRADLGDGRNRDLRRGLRAPLRLPHPDPGLRPARLVEQDPLEVGTAPRHIHRGAHPHREHPESGPLSCGAA